MTDSNVLSSAQRPLLTEKDQIAYNDLYSSAEILTAIYNDLPLARPSSNLSMVMSSYASMRLGVHTDSTNAVPSVPIGDDYDAPYKIRMDSLHPDDEYRRPDISSWVTALTWGPRQANMLPLSDGVANFIEEPSETVEYISVLAHEWRNSPTQSNQESVPPYYARTGLDAIFRLTTHKAKRFVSKPSSTRTNQHGLSHQYFPDNLLHVASIWDTAKEKWLLLGTFLCSGEMAIGHLWKRSAREADDAYSEKQGFGLSNPRPKKHVTIGNTSDISVSPAVNEEDEGEGEEDDDYWNQYDDLAGSDDDPEANNESGENRGEELSRRKMEEENDSDDYYNSYNNVESMIHGDDVDRRGNVRKDRLNYGADNIEVGATDQRILRPETPVWPGAFPASPIVPPTATLNSEPSKPIQDQKERDIIKTHVQESVNSLYKLAKAQGISTDEFTLWALEALH